ncbi:hypothetical protein EXIGLDRAFT_777128 [Exidia glandulosa HHB12029]|uniref:GPI anchored protein n=1 Tax=Exidia glandulosa HHB12029 TaxID=1314781 RepID=A0A165D6C4_EXIGL|nr:hypothetical protein EXIGLDRAFT_777128 [Exidia glandulosa HHB12029]
MRATSLLLLAVVAYAQSETEISSDSNLEQFPTVIDPSKTNLHPTGSFSLTLPTVPGTIQPSSTSTSTTTGTTSSIQPTVTANTTSSSTISIPSGVIPTVSSTPTPTTTTGSAARLGLSWAAAAVCGALIASLV